VPETNHSFFQVFTRSRFFWVTIERTASTPQRRGCLSVIFSVYQVPFPAEVDYPAVLSDLARAASDCPADATSPEVKLNEVEIPDAR